jgi:hypothetical protein
MGDPPTMNSASREPQVAAAPFHLHQRHVAAADGDQRGEIGVLGVAAPETGVAFGADVREEAADMARPTGDS